jgi:AcrR family transcriptional regulator
MPGAPLTRGERKRRQHEEMVEDILTIARDMMRADGVAALNFNGIARQLGMRPPSLYTYFPSKDAIYDELFRRGFLAFGDYMDARVELEGPPAVCIRSAFRAYMGFGQENPDLFQLMFQRPIPGFTPSDASMDVSLNRLALAGAQIAQILGRSGVPESAPIEETRDLLIAMMHGLTELHLANDPDAPVGEGRFGMLIDQAVDLFVRAWSADARSA